MSTILARWQIIYGIFLIVAGVAGYLSNPEKAKTALLSGGTFGGLSVLWGVLAARGYGWSGKAALVTTGLLMAAFTWRASVGWMAVLSGNDEKLFTASLISLMLAASAAMFVALLKFRSRDLR